MEAEAVRQHSAIDPPSLLAEVYAEALVSLVGEESLGALLDELEALLATMDRVEGSRALLMGDVLSRRETSALVDRVFRGRCSEVVWSLLGVLAQRGRMALLPATVRQLRRELDAVQRRVEVIVTTAVPVAEQRREDIRRRIAESLDIAPVATFLVDERLMGGMVLRVGGREYDASTATKLAALRQRVADRLAGEKFSSPLGDDDQSRPGSRP